MPDTHHCPTCRHSANTRCVRNGHIYRCHSHPSHFVLKPGNPCATCDQEEDLRATAAHKAHEASKTADTKADDARKKEAAINKKNEEQLRKQEESRRRKEQFERQRAEARAVKEAAALAAEEDESAPEI